MSSIRLLFMLAVCGMTALAGPRGRVEPDSVDFGNVKAGEKAEQTVTIHNEGDASLTVLSAKASCGCTSVELPVGEAATIAPGQSLRVPVRFDSTGRNGKQASVIAITTNDPDRPALTIGTTASVQSLTVLRPPSGLLWQQSPRGDEIRRTVVIVPGDATQEIELLDVKSDQPVLTVSAAKVTRNGQQMIDVKCALAKDAPLGELAATVEARVRVGGEETTVTIPARGVVAGDVMVSPTEVRAPRGVTKRGGPIGDVLMRASRGGRAPDIAGLEVIGPARAELEPVRGDDLRRIVISAAADAPSGPCSATLIIMTSAADQPVVDVPIYFDVASDITVAPETVVLDFAHAAQRIELRSANGAMEVKEITFDKTLFAAAIKTPKQTSADNPAVVEVSLVETKLDSPRGAILTIATDVPGDSSVRIPVLIRP